VAGGSGYIEKIVNYIEAICGELNPKKLSVFIRVGLWLIIYLGDLK